jgi:hypothetical protein
LLLSTDGLTHWITHCVFGTGQLTCLVLDLEEEMHKEHEALSPFQWFGTAGIFS